MNSSMKGTLSKWTNYISGWQPRWFVLESGILSYSFSPEEAIQGSRRSYKAASCDIKVDKNDELRLQIVTPNKDTLHLRAESRAERQQWVLALASAKLEEGQATTPGPAEVVHRGHPVRKKVSQLRETGNHLITEVHSIKAANAQSPPDVKSMEQLASSLSITCDDFVRLVTECVELATQSNVVTPVGVSRTFNFNNIVRSKRGSASDDEARHHNLTPSHHHGVPIRHTPTQPLPSHLTHTEAPSQSSKEVDFVTSTKDVFITPSNSPETSPPPSPTPHPHSHPPHALTEPQPSESANND